MGGLFLRIGLWSFRQPTGVGGPPWRKIFTQAKTTLPAFHDRVFLPFYFSNTVPLLDKSVRLFDSVDFDQRSQLSPGDFRKVKFDERSEYVMRYLVDLTYYSRMCSFAQ